MFDSFRIGLGSVTLAIVASFAAPSSAQEPSEEAVLDYNAIVPLQQSGYYDKAAERWTQFLQKHPKYPKQDRVLHLLGICQIQTKKYPAAIQTLDSLLAKYPKFEDAPAAQYNLGMAHYQVAAESKKPEDFRKAATALALVGSKHPQSKQAPRAVYFEAEALLNAQDKAGAAAAYARIPATWPADPLALDAWYALGVLRQEAGEHEPAAAALESFLKLPAAKTSDLLPEVQLRLGVSQFGLRKFAEAEPNFAAAAAAPNFALADFALLKRGETELETGKTDLALKTFADLAAKFPKSAYLGPGQLAAGKGLYQKEKYEDAFKVLAPLAAGDTVQAAEASYWLGLAHLKRAKPQEALAALEAAAKKFTTGEFAPYLALTRIEALAEIPERKSEAPALFAAFAQAQAAHPLAPRALYLAAHAAFAARDLAGARRHADAFLANPTYAALPTAAEVLFIAGESRLADPAAPDPAGAEKFYRQLVEKFPQHAHAARSGLRIAWALHQGKKFAEAAASATAAANAAQAPGPKAEALLIVGLSQAALGQHEAAAATLVGALALKADWDRADEARLAAAASLRKANKPADAAVQLQALLTQFPKSPLVPLALREAGDVALAAGKLDEAIKHFQAFVGAYPQDAAWESVQLALANVHFQKNAYSETVLALAKLVGSADRGVAQPALLLRGIAHQRQKQLEPASKDLQAFLAGNPPPEQALDARYALTLCQIGLEQFAPASESLAAIVKAKPDYAHLAAAYYELGHALRTAKKPAEAAQAFLALTEKAPASPLVPEAWFHVGDAQETSAQQAEEKDRPARWTEAAQAYAAGAAAAPAGPLKEKLQYKLGDMQFKLGKFPEAAAALAVQLQAHPQGELAGPARYLAGEANYRQEKFAEALPLFAAAGDGKTKAYHEPALYRAGDCAMRLKKWAESEQYFSSLLAAFPKSEHLAEARYGIAYAQHNQGQLAKARQNYELAAAPRSPTAAKAWFGIGELVFGEKKYAEAFEIFSRVQSYPNPELKPAALYEAAKCLIEDGKKDQAVKLLKQLQAEHAAHPRAQDAAQLLSSLK